MKEKRSRGKNYYKIETAVCVHTQNHIPFFVRLSNKNNNNAPIYNITRSMVDLLDVFFFSLKIHDFCCFAVDIILSIYGYKLWYRLKVRRSFGIQCTLLIISNPHFRVKTMFFHAQTIKFIDGN